MNILFITHYSELYGANRSLLDLIEGLGQYGVRAIVVLPREGTLSTSLREKNIPFVIQSFYWWCGEQRENKGGRLRRWASRLKRYQRNRKKYQHNLHQLANLKKQLNDWKPDFVHSNSSVFNFGLLYSRKYNLPHIWHLRENKDHYQLKWFNKINYINKSFRQSEILIAVSEFLKDLYSSRHHLNDIEVIYNGVLSSSSLLKLDELRESKQAKVAGSMVFGIVGLIHPKKGLEDAIRAFSRVNKLFPLTKLLIVGAGDQTHLRNLIEELEVNKERVEFWGHIPNPFEAFLKMDVALTCSRMEGMGRVTIEAMATGLPVIGYKEGGTIELIDEQETGLFYSKGFEDLADKMLYLINHPAEQLRMGELARMKFEKHYTIEIYAENFIQVIKKYKNHIPLG